MPYANQSILRAAACRQALTAAAQKFDKAQVFAGGQDRPPFAHGVVRLVGSNAGSLSCRIVSYNSLKALDLCDQLMFMNLQKAIPLACPQPQLLCSLVKSVTVFR